MDFPGFGFPDKPLGWGYSLYRDADALEHSMTEVLGLESTILYAHDRGSSVAIIHTTRVASRVGLEHLFLTNANVCLPMSNLTQAQRVMLDPATGPAALAETILHALDALDAPDDTPPGAIAPRPGSPLSVDRSHPELLRAADLLTRPG